MTIAYQIRISKTWKYACRAAAITLDSNTA